ncbi:MAG: hypothetical protein V1784_00885 [bacterium]
MKQEPNSIVTHNDFDGVGSAAICAWAFDIESVRFAGPMTISRAEIPITKADIVCDLPYPLECGMWFDHHAGNLDEVKLRGIDATTIPGRFAPELSCVRVICNYFSENDELPDDFAKLADAADAIDSFSYRDIDDWRRETAAKRIDWAIKASASSAREQHDFLRELVFLLRDSSMEEVAEQPEVIARAVRYREEEADMLEKIQSHARFLDEDTARELVIIDLTKLRVPVHVDKKLAGLIFPEAKGFVELKPVFRQGQKAHDISVSLSLALPMQHQSHPKNMGEIVRTMNLGDGHIGAAAGLRRCESGSESHRAKDEILKEIWRLWSEQK